MDLKPFRQKLLNSHRSNSQKTSILSPSTDTISLTKLFPVCQWRSQEGARAIASPKLPSCPQTNSFEKFFWLHLRLMYPRMSQYWEYKPQIFSARFARSIVFLPLFHTMTSNYCPLNFSRPPNRRSLATCLLYAVDVRRTNQSYPFN